jgi:DNA mismatch repair ATPase MutS
MAGKSTLLRAIGLNAVLAGAGTTVCAAGARMTVFSVCASISVADSLMEAKSRFLAEIERVRMAVEATRDAQPVLFLLDEILSGTNSHDRRIAAEAVLRTLVAHGAVGALSTHDLALTELAERLGGANFHMQSQRSSDPLSFDFRLKSGIAQLSNGLAIVRLMGLLPEERKEAGVGME